MNKEQRDHLRQLAAKAEPGPYEAYIDGDETNGLAVVVQKSRGEICFGINPDGTPDMDNARFYAACTPETIVALLDMIDAQEPPTSA